MSPPDDERRQARALLIDTLQSNLGARKRLADHLDELIERGRASPLSPAALDLVEQIFREIDAVDDLIGEGRQLLHQLGD
ncbi:MAG TPA: hypothetical protein VII56_08310 [Rhizomicrobium sp.]